MERRDFIQFLAAGFLAVDQLLGQNPMIQGSYSRDQLIGKDNSDLVGSDFQLHKAVMPEFLNMQQAAAEDGFQIEVVSAFRSFDRQRAIFERKYRANTATGMSPLEAIKKIIEYSTIPGTSRHHWGTDVDIIDGAVPRPDSVLEARHFEGNGPFCPLKEWLNKHAASFGFFEVYTDLPDRKGFKYEPWHFSYAEIAVPMLKAYLDLDIAGVVREENILGSEHFTKEFVSSYRNEHIMDINPTLIPA